MKQSLQKVFQKFFLVILTLSLISVNRAFAAFPAAGGNYTISNAATNYVSGSASGNFQTFTAAIAELNASSAVTLTAPITFTVTSNQVFHENISGTVITYANPGGVAITFVKDNSSSTDPILFGNTGTAAADAVITLSGTCNNYTFNGIDLADDSTTNSSNNTYMEYGFYIKGTGANGGCRNNTFENGNITLKSTNGNTTYGIFSSVATSTTTNSFNTISGNNIKVVKFGIYLNNSNNNSSLDGYNVVSGNNISKMVANSAAAFSGIYIYGQQNINVYNNQVSNISFSSPSQIFSGIQFSGSVVNTSANIYGNTIGGNSANSINIAGGSVVDYGILVGTAAGGIPQGSGGSNLLTSDANVYNNVINNITSTSSVNFFGIGLASNVQCDIYSNTIQNITASGCYGIYAIGNNSMLIYHVIYGNTITGLTLTNLSGFAQAIQAQFGGVIYNNLISNITETSTGGNNYAGIYISGQNGGAAPYLSNIYGNTITGLLQLSSAASNGFMYGIFSNSQINPSVYNNIIAVSSLATGTNTVYGIDMVSATNGNIGTSSIPGTSNISGNTISNCRQGTITTNGTTIVTGSGTNFNNEHFVNGTTKVYANGVLIGTVASVQSSTQLTLQASAPSPNLSGVNYAVPAGAGIYGIAGTGTINTITHNTILGMISSGNITNGTAFGIQLNGAAGSTVSNNSISNIVGTNTGSSAQSFGILLAPTTSSTNCYGNTVNNIVTAATTGTGGAQPINQPSTNTCGISANISTAAATMTNIFANVISNVFTSSTNATSAYVNGIALTANQPVTCNIYSNTISSIINNATSSTLLAGGIFLTGSSSTNNVYDNRIFKISSATTTSSGYADGLQVKNSGTTTVYNNMIYDINTDKGTLASAGGASIGIYSNISSATLLRYYYNTVYLDGNAQTGTAQYSSAFYNLAGSTMDVENNVFVNNSNITPTGFAYAYWNSSATLPGTLTNNLLYVGTTSGANHYLFNYGGTKEPALSDYQGAVSGTGDATLSQTLSGIVTPATFFVNTDLGSGPQDVHLSSNGSNTGDAVNKGTVALAAPWNVDFDGDARPYSGNANTTIGADEACSILTPPGSFTAFTSPVCQSTAGAVYTVANNTDANFLWSVPAGAIITAGQNTNSITVAFAPDATSGNISVGFTTGGCGFSSLSQNVVVNASVQTAGVLTGNSTVCAGGTGTYTTPLIPNASSYTFGYTGSLGTGGSIGTPTIGANASVVVTFGSNATSGNISVAGINSADCGGGNGPINYFPVTINTPPGQPSTPTGPLSRCSGSGTSVYTTSATNASSYSWSVTGAGNAINGTGASGTVTWAPSFSGNATVSVAATNTCGTSSPSSPLTVTVNPLPSVFTVSGSSPCGAVIVNQSGSTGGVSYQLYLNGVATGSPISGTGNPINFGSQSATGSYTVIGTGTGGCTANMNGSATVNPTPVGGVVSTPLVIICSGNSTTLTVTGSVGSNLQWQISSNNTTWTDISGATNTSYTTDPGDGATNKFYRMLSKSTACWDVASTTAEVDVSNPNITVTATNITDNSLTLNWSPTGSGNYLISYSGPTSGTQTSVTPPKTITGLSSDGTYNVTVTQTGVSGCSASGTLTGVNTLCAMPTGVTLSSPAPAQIQVSWTGVPGADYRVYYRPLFSYNTYFTKDVSNASSVLLTKQGNNNLYASTTYEVYVSTLDCPSTGAVGQPTSPTNVTTLPTVTCATPVIDSVRSLCPVQIEVFIHDNGVNQYNVFIQRLTPSILAVNSYGVSGTYFTINTPYSGDQYLIAVEARCGSALSSIYVWPGNVTIKPLCTSPNNLVLSNPTCHGFTASWNADQCLSNSASAYDLYLRVAGTINYNSYGVTLPANGVGPNKLVNWLTTGRTYQVFVRSVYNCNGFVTYGPSSQVQTITTLSSGCRDEEQTNQPQENKPATQQYSPDNREVFSLYPNPNNGEFIIDLSRLSMEEDAVRIEVLNMLGQIVLTHLTAISGGQMSEYINLPNGIAAGTYIVRLTAGKNLYTAKINVSK